MLLPFFIFHCSAHIAASPFMESILAGKYGINMEEIRKYLVKNFMLPMITNTLSS